MTNSITVSLPTPNSSNLTQSSSRPVLSRLHLKTEKARRTLHEFVVQAWPLLEPATPFVEGMHVRAVCEHLQAVAQGRLRHLIINIPPATPNRSSPPYFGQRGYGLIIPRRDGCLAVIASRWPLATGSNRSEERRVGKEW